MNALPYLEVLLEADRGQAPPKEACRDERTRPQDEDASEGFIDGAGI